MFLNTNLSAVQSARFLASSNSLLSKALARLSSGNRIVSPEDDAGGLAQSSKMNSQVHRIDALVQNTQNLVSYLQTQEGFLGGVSKALDRMSEIAVLSKDVTKSTSDIDAYTEEYSQLQGYITDVYNKKFNGVNLFSDRQTRLLTDADGNSKDFEAVNLASAVGKGNGEFTIQLNFTGDLTDDQKNLFYAAANRWQSIITEDLVDVGAVDDLSITVNASAIDGVNGTLGSGGPSTWRSGPETTITGSMNFDTADLPTLEKDGRLYGVILHEMGHVLGIGTLWTTQGLISTSGPDGPVYNGTAAVEQYNEIFNTNFSSVPIEDGGGGGTALAHPEEGDNARTIGGDPAPGLDNEVMTGYAEAADVPMPLSKISIGFLEDLGYAVDYSEADAYSGPGTGSGPGMGPAMGNLDNIKRSVENVAGLRAKVGAMLSDARNQQDSLLIEKENLSAAMSRIRDVDVATETMAFTKAQILVNSGTAMLAQANVIPQNALRLIGG